MEEVSSSSDLDETRELTDQESDREDSDVQDTGQCGHQMYFGF